MDAKWSREVREYLKQGKRGISRTRLVELLSEIKERLDTHTNSAITVAALADLLVRKGIVTEDEIDRCANCILTGDEDGCDVGPAMQCPPIAHMPAFQGIFEPN